MAVVGGTVCLAAMAAGRVQASDYVVVVSSTTYALPDWRQVVDRLVDKHQAQVITFDHDVADSLPKLKETFPRYACFVATSAEAGRQLVADVHRLTRRLDDDPYTDLFWGILTGFDAANALAIANQSEPLEVQRVASGTELAMDRVKEGVWFSELQQNMMVRKEAGGEVRTEKGPDDTTEALARTLTDQLADLFVTSGHATERDWQIGFSYRNGSFQSRGGRLVGVDTRGREIPIESPHPKVYLAVGNCLMGHVDGPDAMALAFMNSAGVRQMIGYTVLTWYGYAGWGCLDYFVEQPGRYTLAEAFLANQLALTHRLETNFPEIARLDTPPGSYPRVQVKLSESARAAGLSQQDGVGLLHDRDVVAFYGDPAWSARMAPGPLSFEQTLTEPEPGVFELTITPLVNEKSFQPVNTNGSQRGGRPVVQFLPRRIGTAQLESGSELHPVITDNFILVPLESFRDPSQTYRIRFAAPAL